MPQITKPLLAGSFDEDKAVFPYLATPKIDGIRFLMINGKALSRSFKDIRNDYIQEFLSKNLPDGLDGELTVGDSFSESSSGIMSEGGQPDFTCWLFDYVDPNVAKIATYEERMRQLNALPLPRDPRVKILNPVLLKDMAALDAYEEACLNKGYEGIMVRSPKGTYKFGRSTVRQNILLKVKRFRDDEAEIIGIEEEETEGANGVRIGNGTTGTLLLRHANGMEFGVYSGLDDDLRDRIWARPNAYIGKLVKYKYFPHGMKDRPRHPVFLGFRDRDDMS